MTPTLPALPPRPEMSAPALPDAGGGSAAEATRSPSFARALRDAEAAPPEAADRGTSSARARNEGGPRERSGAPRSSAREARDPSAHKSEGERGANASAAPAADDTTKAAASGDARSADAPGIVDRAVLLEGAAAATAAGEEAPKSHDAAAADMPPTIALAAAGQTTPRGQVDGPVGEDADVPLGCTGGSPARGGAARHGLAAANPSNAATRFEPAAAADERAAAPARPVVAPVDAERGLPLRAALALESSQTGPRAPAIDVTMNAPSVALASTAVVDRPAAALQPTLAGTNGATAQAQLGAAPGSAEFAPALGTQVAVWLREGVQEAQLQLHPAELGPVAVQIALDGLQAQVDFHAAHARTRDAIEASLPSLAAALRDAGFTLAGGGVFGQGAGENGARSLPRPLRGAAARDDEAAGRVDGDPLRRAPPGGAWRRGLLDVFA